MARKDSPKEKDEVQPTPLELKGSEAVVRPQFSNYVHSNHAKLSGARAETTLTFIHIYPLPTSAAESKPEGEIVARVVLDDETAKGLRDLLARQHPFTAAQLQALKPRRQRTRSRE